MHNVSHFKRVDTYIRYLNRVLLIFFLLAFLTLPKTKHWASESGKRGRESEWMDGVVERHSNPMHVIAVIHISIVWCFSSHGENDKYKQGARRVSFDTFLIYVHVFVGDEHRFLFHFLCMLLSSPRRYGHYFATTPDSTMNSGTGISWSGFRRTQVYYVICRRFI